MVNTLSATTPVSSASPRPASAARRYRPQPGHRPVQHRSAQPEGLLQVTTAPFRGSFNGVLSQAIRAAGQGSRVLIAQFLKGGVNQGPRGAVWLCGRLEWMRPAIDCCLHEDGVAPEHQQAVQEVWAVTRERLLDNSVNLMVLDELGLALKFGLLDNSDVVSTLKQRPASLDLTLLGSGIPADILAMANQITELRRYR